MKDFTIITGEMLEEENWCNFLDEKVLYELNFLKDYYSIMLNDSIVNCESPVEQLLSLHLKDLKYGFNHWNPFIDISDFIPNQEIICKNGKKYRLDFYFIVNYKNQGVKYFGIECDGYEFHQKTKEQAKNDYERQRDLQKEGIEIIRFTGSEIWEDPRMCVIEIKEIILSKCQYILEEKTNG